MLLCVCYSVPGDDGRMRTATTCPPSFLPFLPIIFVPVLSVRADDCQRISSARCIGIPHCHVTKGQHPYLGCHILLLVSLLQVSGRPIIGHTDYRPYRHHRSPITDSRYDTLAIAHRPISIITQEFRFYYKKWTDIFIGRCHKPDSHNGQAR